MYSEKQADAIDLSHHLSDVSKARLVSPLKGLQKYMKPGTPPPDYFPFASLSGELLVPNSFPLSTSPSSSLSWFWRLFGSGKKEKTETVTVQKWPAQPGDLNLAQLLQYSPATGDSHLADIVKEFTDKVYQPAYKNYTTLVSAGNTDGWGRAALTLLNPGEGFLACEWTYASALASIKPWGVKPVPIAMDGQGMSSLDLRNTLANWDENARGMKRPHVMYIIPIGQNPTGATMQAQRKKEIYEICVNLVYVIIVEDDPYYFLQEGEYVPKAARVNVTQESDEEKFIASLAPSFLKYAFLLTSYLFAYWRVIRLDTFSKTVAPGCRLGWFTCNPLFAERLERAGETSTQSPCGFGQGMVAALLLHWHFEGYIRWLQALRLQYQARRDFFLDSLATEFHLDLAIGTLGQRQGARVCYASLKPQRVFSEKAALQGSTKPVFSFIPPSSGMFVWLKLHLEDFVTSPLSTLGYKQLEMKLWAELAEAGVLFGPGYIFSAADVSDDMHGDGHFRIAYSSASEEEVKKAVTIFGAVIRKFVLEL
ncbi:pyridoxal phosphate-dependent transferase [Mucidula mucida]|nr:pyridoxal phosphate-dependent transferase [Mucidula mucida]